MGFGISAILIAAALISVVPYAAIALWDRLHTKRAEA